MDTKKLRRKILDLAIHGKLVPQDPNDEPASILLERIRAEKEALIKEGKIKRVKKAASSDMSHYENVPDGWSRVKVKDVCIFNSGFAFSSESYKNSGTPLIRISNIKDGSVTLDECVFVDPVSDARFFVNKGDLLIAMSGATTGKMGIYEKEYPAMLNQRVGNVKIVSEEILLPGYRDLFFKSLEPQILKDAYGGAQPNISAKDICEYDLLLPPITEQYRIIQEANKYLRYLEVVEHNAEKLEENISWTKAHLLEMAISGKLVPQDPSDEPAINLLKRINPSFKPCDNSQYEKDIPSTWVCTTIGSIFQHNTGKALNKSTSSVGSLLPYLTTSNVYWNSFDLSVVKKMRFKDNEMDKCTVRKGDLLVCEGGDIGRSAIWDRDYTVCIQNHLHRLRPKGDIIPLLYMYFIMYLKRTDNIEGKGIGLQGLSSGMLDKLEVPLPPYNEQKRIVSKIQEAFDTLDSISGSLN